MLPRGNMTLYFKCLYFDQREALYQRHCRIIASGKDLWYCEDSVRRALQQGARVIVVSPLYGLPIEWEELSRLASEFGAEIIEDAAQGHGAAWRGRPLGTLGQISILSFGRGKGWTGGAWRRCSAARGDRRFESFTPQAGRR